MAKKPVVKIFDPKNDITLTTNAISGILSQKEQRIKSKKGKIYRAKRPQYTYNK